MEPLRYSEGPDSMSWSSPVWAAKRALYGGRIKRLAPQAVRVHACTKDAFCIAMGRTTAEALEQAAGQVEP